MQQTDDIVIRRATPEDAESILQSHLASIHGLCGRDYSDEEITAWTGPKRAEQYRRHMQQGHAIFVATAGERIVGFGELAEREILGLYVHPQFVRRGVGKRLLAALEAEARHRGSDEIRLNSTLTARHFYHAHGYEALAETTHTVSGNIKLRCIAMRKRL